MYAFGVVLSVFLVVTCFTGCSDDSDGDGPGILVANPNTLDNLGIGQCSAGTTSNGTFQVGPATPPLGTGSFLIVVGADGTNSGEELRFSKYDGVRLDQITQLSYSTYTQVPGALNFVNVTLVLNLDWNGDSIQDDRLYFEPIYQTGAIANFPTQGPPVVDTWQSWDTLIGGWWSINEPMHIPGVGVNTIPAYLALHPDATLLASTMCPGGGGLRISAGFGGTNADNFVGNFDALIVGVNSKVDTYDMEP
jgi:hypothetical protein